MNVIRMIKLFGWEPKVREEISDKREEELVWIKKRMILDLINGSTKWVTLLLTALPTTTYQTLMIYSQIYHPSPINGGDFLHICAFVLKDDITNVEPSV